MSNPFMQDALKLTEAAQDGSKMPTAHQAIWIAMAQVRATLALAYEQRTANLIAAERLAVAIDDSESATGTQMPAAISERL